MKRRCDGGSLCALSLAFLGGRPILPTGASAERSRGLAACIAMAQLDSVVDMAQEVEQYSN